MTTPLETLAGSNWAATGELSRSKKLLQKARRQRAILLFFLVSLNGWGGMTVLERGLIKTLTHSLLAVVVCGFVEDLELARGAIG